MILKYKDELTTYLKIGNATASGTAGNKRGHLRIYGEGVGYSELVSNATTNRLITFPDASGTVSLNGHTHNYLPLSGGSVTGDISRKSDSNVDGYYRAERTDLTFTDSKGKKQHEDVRFGISAAGNRGIWDRRLEKWLVRADTSGNVYFGDPSYAAKTTIRGKAIKHISGTSNTNINISERNHALIIVTKRILYEFFRRFCLS